MCVNCVSDVCVYAAACYRPRPHPHNHMHPILQVAVAVVTAGELRDAAGAEAAATRLLRCASANQQAVLIACVDGADGDAVMRLQTRLATVRLDASRVWTLRVVDTLPTAAATIQVALHAASAAVSAQRTAWVDGTLAARYAPRAAATAVLRHIPGTSWAPRGVAPPPAAAATGAAAAAAAAAAATATATDTDLHWLLDAFDTLPDIAAASAATLAARAPISDADAIAVAAWFDGASPCGDS